MNAWDHFAEARKHPFVPEDVRQLERMMGEEILERPRTWRDDVAEDVETNLALMGLAPIALIAATVMLVLGLAVRLGRRLVR